MLNKIRDPENMSTQTNNFLRQWFLDYEKAVNSFDAERVSSQYTDCYIEAGPKGTNCIKNDDDYRAAISKRKQVFKSLGFQFAKILSVDITPVDENYAMAKVDWQMQFKKDREEIVNAEFAITYIVYTRNDDPKVVFYISHEDEEEMMRDLGLLPP